MWCPALCNFTVPLICRSNFGRVGCDKRAVIVILVFANLFSLIINGIFVCIVAIVDTAIIIVVLIFFPQTKQGNRRWGSISGSHDHLVYVVDALVFRLMGSAIDRIVLSTTSAALCHPTPVTVILPHVVVSSNVATAVVLASPRAKAVRATADLPAKAKAEKVSTVPAAKATEAKASAPPAVSWVISRHAPRARRLTRARSRLMAVADVTVPVHRPASLACSALHLRSSR